ncbi:TPA: hypothetical protein ACGSDF_002955 [Escherichia coli]
MSALRDEVSMKVAFSNGMINKLCKSFFYSHGKEQPCIQVGKALEDFVFWLAYNDEEIAKCASRLLKAYGPQLGISDLHNAKRLLLGFCSEAFNRIDADFLSLNPDKICVDDIITQVHRKNLSEMFKYYILSRIKLCPYIYNLGCAGFDGKLELRENLFLYGPGLGVELLSDIKDKTDIKVPVDFYDDEYMRHKPIGKYFRQSKSCLVVAYASSEDKAVKMFDSLFGALCLAVDNPFAINRVAVNNLVESFGVGKYHESEFRVNIPSVYNLNITNSALAILTKILSSPDKRMLSALSFIAHGWRDDKRERFLNQFIALDAMYGTNNGNKNSIIGGVCRDAAKIIDIDSKIGIIYELRCKFVHGDISSLSDNDGYRKFIDSYGVDPIVSLFEILKECVLNYNGTYKTPKDVGKADRSICVPAELLPAVERMIAEYSGVKKTN